MAQRVSRGGMGMRTRKKTFVAKTAAGMGGVLYKPIFRSRRR